jgi:hypothetical protein
MSDVAALLDRLHGTPVASLADAELTGALVDLGSAIDELTALRREVAAEWDHRMVWAGDGARSGAAWLAHNTEISRGRAGTELRVARRLRSMPHLAQASASGALGAEKVQAISHAVDNDKTGQLAELFSQHERRLVCDAKHLEVDQTRTAVAYWRSCAADTTNALDPEGQVDARELRLTPAYDGMVDLIGRFDPVAARLIEARLEAEIERSYRAERATLAEGERPRCAKRRRADALLDLLTRAPATEVDEQQRPLPLLLVDVPLEALEARTGKPATLPDGTPLSYETLARLCCEAGVASIITRGGHAVVDLGRTSYTPNRAQRRALVKRDRQCTFPGCDRPAIHCEPHHLWPWQHGGHTGLWNLTLLCRFHHHLVHEGGFRYLPDAEGVLHVYRPDGTELHPPAGREPHRIAARPPAVKIPPEWTARDPCRAPPGHHRPPGATAAGTAPPGGWDPNCPPDPDVDELAYRRWQDYVVRRRVGLVA